MGAAEVVMGAVEAVKAEMGAAICTDHSRYPRSNCNQSSQTQNGTHHRSNTTAPGSLLVATAKEAVAAVGAAARAAGAAETRRPEPRTGAAEVEEAVQPP